MKKIVFGALLAATLVTPAIARDDIVKITLDSVMEQPDAKAKLDGSVRFFLDGAKTPRILKKLGSDTTNQKTNAFNKSADVACKWTTLSALIALQDGARRAGANAVVNIVSYYKKETVTSPTDIDCHSGALIAGVALKGDYVQIAP
jgi:uncharacterized protein YbjQ (UPF0145 family)